MGNEKIKDIPSFLARVKSLHSLTNEGITLKNNDIYYRGQANSKWKITAGLFRDKDYTLCEYDILNKATNTAYQYLKDCKNTFEKVVVMQHYGLKTRILDITTNPLVALYFACCDEFEKDGSVYYGYNELQEPLIANLILDVVSEKNSNELDNDYFGILAKKLSEIKEMSISVETTKKFLANSQCVCAPHNSPRIIAQRGAFIVAPLLEKKRDIYLKIKSHEFKVGEEEAFFGNIIIDHEKKKDIIQDLSDLGINEATLFPEMDHLMNYVNQIHSKDAFMNGYLIDI